LLAVLAHPDDESLGFGGTLARYAAESVETYLVTATRGERGRFGALGKSGDPEEVGRVREAELREAAAMLGIRKVSILTYMDGAVDEIPAAIAIRAIASHIRRKVPVERNRCSSGPAEQWPRLRVFRTVPVVTLESANKS
jgi:LmbE family N-acetylglucosaminyl deacetylase